MQRGHHWTVSPDARLPFAYRAKNANLVLACTGKVTVTVNGRTTTTKKLGRVQPDGCARRALPVCA
ncbi:hypothetical protein ACWGQ9_25690 [Streptomyces parvus]